MNCCPRLRNATTATATRATTSSPTAAVACGTPLSAAPASVAAPVPALPDQFAVPNGCPGAAFQVSTTNSTQAQATSSHTQRAANQPRRTLLRNRTTFQPTVTASIAAFSGTLRQLGRVVSPIAGTAR